MMASQLGELDEKAFLSNSDAHSLSKMGREYNIFEMEEANYEEILKAFKGIDGRKIKANFRTGSQAWKISQDLLPCLRLGNKRGSRRC